MTTGGFDPQYGAPRYDRIEAGALLPRFFARVVDGFLVGIVGFVVGFVTNTWSNVMVTGLFTGLLMFVYFVAFEVSQGWTPGKKMLGLRVRGPADSPKPDLQQSAIRNAFTLLPIVPFIGGLLGVIAIIVIAVTISGSPTKQGKHDELAGGTQVLEG
ncbi:RDD family protein [Mycolicibacterium hodleri]|uniref:RDD family protein n=1 Tax=Mycolicibacterium hodleri TaxID=49897 RepID=A0A502EAI7_9MYCO|nr:RDD family protein [Mycolicibacterium hodleri]TPG33526.1 RDD family protein [Mycolicibacterium hodleri]